MMPTTNQPIAARLAALPGVRRLPPGKVRDRYIVDDVLLLVASDRISAFDVVLPTPVPDKGAVLTGLSDFWLDHLDVAHHRISCDPADFPTALAGEEAALRGRAMLCRRADPLPVECVVRGYLAGSGWRDYVATGRISGIALPPGMRRAAQLHEPIFTPSTKAETGHDQPITFDDLANRVGRALAGWLRDTSVALYRAAAEHAAGRGILLADTKFEFGMIEGQPVLIDEVCTPDSSRFWPAEGHRPGRAPHSFDKQYVRDWLDAVGWDRTPPAPALPADVVARTRERYVRAYEALTDRRFVDWMA